MSAFKLLSNSTDSGELMSSGSYQGVPARKPSIASLTGGIPAFSPERLVLTGMIKTADNVYLDSFNIRKVGIEKPPLAIAIIFIQTPYLVNWLYRLPNTIYTKSRFHIIPTKNLKLDSVYYPCVQTTKKEEWENVLSCSDTTLLQFLTQTKPSQHTPIKGASSSHKKPQAQTLAYWFSCTKSERVSKESKNLEMQNNTRSTRPKQLPKQQIQDEYY